MAGGPQQVLRDDEWLVSIGREMDLQLTVLTLLEFPLVNNSDGHPQPADHGMVQSMAMNDEEFEQMETGIMVTG